MKNQEIRQSVTNKIIMALKNGTRPWAKPWSNATNAGAPSNFVAKRPYRGINHMLLLMAGYESCYWGTLNAWQTRYPEIYVPATSQPTSVLFFKLLDGRVVGGRTTKVPLFRLYPVYNVEQIQPLETEWLAKRSRTELVEIARSHKIFVDPSHTKMVIARNINAAANDWIERYRVVGEVRNTDPDFAPAERLIIATGADITISGNRACYNANSDKIRMPSKRRFNSVADYYETMFHELSHWADNKLFKRKKEKHTYAFKELVAEISACFLCAEINVPSAEKMLEQSAAYVDIWLKEMGQNPKFIFDAAAQAGKVVDYILSLKHKKRKKAA